LHFLLIFIIKLPVRQRTDNYFKINPFEEDIMKKVLSIAAIVMVTLVLVGCGNSPDGDMQKLGSTTVSTNDIA